MEKFHLYLVLALAFIAPARAAEPFVENPAAAYCHMLVTAAEAAVKGVRSDEDQRSVAKHVLEFAKTQWWNKYEPFVGQQTMLAFGMLGTRTIHSTADLVNKMSSGRCILL